MIAVGYLLGENGGDKLFLILDQETLAVRLPRYNFGVSIAIVVDFTKHFMQPRRKMVGVHGRCSNASRMVERSWSKV